MGLNVQNSGIQKLAETSSLRILEMSLTQKKHNFEQRNIFLASFVFVGKFSFYNSSREMFILSWHMSVGPRTPDIRYTKQPKACFIQTFCTPEPHIPDKTCLIHGNRIYQTKSPVFKVQVYKVQVY